MVFSKQNIMIVNPQEHIARQPNVVFEQKFDDDLQPKSFEYEKIYEDG